MYILFTLVEILVSACLNELNDDDDDPLFQFVNFVQICMVNNFMHSRPYLSQLYGDVWAVRR